MCGTTCCGSSGSQTPIQQSPVQQSHAQVDQTELLRAASRESQGAAGNALIARVSTDYSAIITPIDYSQAKPEVAAALQDFDQQVGNQALFLKQNVAPTVIANARSTGSLNQSALMRISKDSSQLVTFHALVDFLAKHGGTATIADVRAASDMYKDAQERGSVSQGDLVALTSSIAVREGRTTPAAARLAQELAAEIGHRLDFLGARVLPTIYANAQAAGEIDRSALARVAEDQSKLVSAISQIRKLALFGSSLTDDDIAQARQRSSSSDAFASALAPLIAKIDASQQAA